MTDPRPTADVVAAFGLAGEDVVALDGGDEASVVVDRAVVLKKVDDVVLTEWCQELLDQLDTDELRIPAPVRSANGRWSIDGWVATEFIGGLTSMRSDPRRIIAVGERFSHLATVVASDTGPVLQRTDRWATADRYVWGEQDLELDPPALETAAALRAHLSPGNDTSVVVHGDLTGNVFTDRDGVPVVLDFTPYVRPRRYGSAIVVADNLLWHAAGTELCELIDDDGLARALLFRLVAEQLAERPRHGGRLDDHLRVLSMLGWA